MMKTSISGILKKYLSGRFSPETEERVQKWMIREDHQEEKEQASLAYWDGLDSEATAEAHSALNRVNQRIGYSPKQVFKIDSYRAIRRIAAVLLPLFMVAGGYFYYQSTQNDLIEIAVAYGEEKHLFLPDSSEVWLNAGTTIKYPKRFKNNRRTIYLNGEAYFSVKRNEEKPFIVQAENVSVKVLGTKFNVKAYADDENITTALTSGKVEVSADNESRILKPNQQLTYNQNTSTMDIVEIPSDETDSWLSGRLIFNNSSFKEIVQTVERRFGISITNNTEIPASKLYTVKFLRNDSPEDILNILQDVVGFRYRKQGDEILLMKK